MKPVLHRRGELGEVWTSGGPEGEVWVAQRLVVAINPESAYTRVAVGVSKEAWARICRLRRRPIKELALIPTTHHKDWPL